MSPKEVEKIFLEIEFHSDSHDSQLKKIVIIGITGTRAENSELTILEKEKKFFDDLIARKIFIFSRKVKACDFQFLKIWLYNTNLRRDEIPYQLPSLDEKDLEIRSKKPYSKLERIYILDNGLKDIEYRKWCDTAISLFSPLFDGFIAPPEPPSILEESYFKPWIKVATAVNETIDPYASMKQKMWFNALIIQID